MSIIDHILKEKASSVYFELSRMLDEKASEIASQYKDEFDKECFEDINESPLTGNQHKIDANKNGKLDAHDFKLLRAKNDKPPFDQPYSKTKVHKDEYGNVIRNVAKRLAKKGMAANEEAIAEDGASAVLRATVARSKLRDMEGKNKSPKLISKLKSRIKAAEPYYDKPVKEEVESIDELSKGLLNRYQDKNEVDRERLASGLWYPKGEAGATEKQKKDSAKLGKRNSSSYLAFKKANPETWAKNNPPHLRAGDKPARVNATEEVEHIDELSKGLLNKYMVKNYKERNRLASGLPEPGREAEATEKQKKDFAKLDKKVASGYLAHKKAFPKTWAKENPPHRRFTGDEPARIRATEEYVDEKTLTTAEMKKREEVVKAIKRDDPKMDKSMMYAIATKTAKRVAEEKAAALKGKQHKLDKNKNGKLDAHDFKLLRKD